MCMLCTCVYIFSCSKSVTHLWYPPTHTDEISYSESPRSQLSKTWSLFKNLHVFLLGKKTPYPGDANSEASGWKFTHQQCFQSKPLYCRWDRYLFLGLKHPCLDWEHGLRGLKSPPPLPLRYSLLWAKFPTWHLATICCDFLFIFDVLRQLNPVANVYQ